jgi:hypothetical protein
MLNAGAAALVELPFSYTADSEVEVSNSSPKAAVPCIENINIAAGTISRLKSIDYFLRSVR